MGGVGSLYSTGMGFKAAAVDAERQLHFSQSDRRNDRDGHDDAHDRANNMMALVWRGKKGKMRWPGVQGQKFSLRNHIRLRYRMYRR